MSSAGLKMLGSSRLLAWIMIESGANGGRANKGEPQFAQNPRFVIFPLSAFDS